MYLSIPKAQVENSHNPPHVLSTSENLQEKFVLNQKFDIYGNFRKENWINNQFNCSISRKKDFINAKAVVLNSFRTVDFNSYAYSPHIYKELIVLKTTSIATTNDWTRNCQQAHTQALDSFFLILEDCAIVLEDDLFETSSLNSFYYIQTINCAIENKVDFLYFKNHNVMSYWYGTRGYLISRIFYYDTMKNICFAKNSHVPIDDFWLKYFNLLMTFANLVNYTFSLKGTTKDNFDISTKADAVVNDSMIIKFDDPMFDITTNNSLVVLYRMGEALIATFGSREKQ